MILERPSAAEDEVFERMATTGEIPVVAPDQVGDDEGGTLLTALAGTGRP